MKTITEKLKSRKLWASMVGVIVGLAMVFGLDKGTVSDVAGSVVSAASIVAYILGEAKIDAAAVGAVAQEEKDDNISANGL